MMTKRRAFPFRQFICRGGVPRIGVDRLAAKPADQCVEPTGAQRHDRQNGDHSFRVTRFADLADANLQHLAPFPGRRTGFRPTLQPPWLFSRNSPIRRSPDRAWPAGELPRPDPDFPCSTNPGVVTIARPLQSEPTRTIITSMTSIRIARNPCRHNESCGTSDHLLSSCRPSSSTHATQR